MIKQVTITGADDSIEPQALIDLSTEFPFVEHGILVSRNNAGGPRFPTYKWMNELRFQVLSIDTGRPKLSLHVCGRWTRQLLLGIDELPAGLIDGFGRIQLNFHAEQTRCKPAQFLSSLRRLRERQFIFQIDGNGGNEHLQSLYREDQDGHVNAVPLFDISGGAGVLPAAWPEPISQVYHGYAGGLGPENLSEQIPLIIKAAGDIPIWIDMETRVRSDNDRTFDLAKVRRCLEIAAPFISTDLA